VQQSVEAEPQSSTLANESLPSTAIIVDDETQKQRVMERGTMTQAQFEAIRAKQLPAAEKCARADYVIETDTIEHAAEQVRSVVKDIRERLIHA
jgi:dephospho-CoA kinase